MEPAPDPLPVPEMAWFMPEPCTPLFCLRPAGERTAFAEGLLSWFIRLARTHAVSPRDLMSEVVGERSPEVRKLCYGTFFRHYSTTINGLGRYAGLFVNILREMSATASIGRHTMLPWRHVIATQGSPVIDHRVRWCSQCLHDMINSGVEPYRMLLWSLHAVELCPIHLAILETRCPHCAAAQPAIPRWPEIVYCDSCRRILLGSRAAHGLRSAADSFTTEALWRAYAVADMVRCGDSADGMGSTDNLKCFVRDMAFAVSRGNRAELCRLIGLPPQALNKWMTGHDKPSLALLLRLLYALDTWPSDIFTAHYSASPLRAVVRNTGHARRCGRRPQPIPGMQAALTATLQLEEPPPLRQFAESVGLSRSGLKYRFPEVCRTITESRRIRRSATTAARLHERQMAVVEIVRQLRETGLWPGRKRVESESRKLGFSLMAEDLRKAYHQALADLVL